MGQIRRRVLGVLGALVVCVGAAGPSQGDPRMPEDAASLPEGEAVMLKDELDVSRPAAGQHVSAVSGGVAAVSARAVGDDTSRQLALTELKAMAGDELVKVVVGDDNVSAVTVWHGISDAQRARVAELERRYGVEIVVDDGARHSAAEVSRAISKVAQNPGWVERLDITMVGGDRRDGIVVSTNQRPVTAEELKELEEFAGVPVTIDTDSGPVIPQPAVLKAPSAEG